MNLTLEPFPPQKPLLSKLSAGTVIRLNRAYGVDDFMIMSSNCLTAKSLSKDSIAVLRLSNMSLEGIADRTEYENLGMLTYKA